LSQAITQCSRPLLGGRRCCHVRGHYRRHSHTWQPGDARYLDIDEKLLDMETGEVVGYGAGLGQRVIENIVSERIANPPSREEIQAKARRVLEVQYGFTIPDEFKAVVHASPPKGYEWHYEGVTKAIGIDASGHNVEFDFTSGKVQRIYSVNQRQEAVGYARRYGSAKAAAEFDIPSATIRSWVGRRAGNGGK
jgi:hypothetical protein